MSLKLNNQQPQTFYHDQPSLPLIAVDVDADQYDLQLKAHTFDQLVKGLLVSKPNTKPATITDTDTNTDISPVDFTEALLAHMSDGDLDMELNNEFKSVYQQAIPYALPDHMSFDQFLLADALYLNNLPYPDTGRIVYLSNEVKEAAANLYDELEKVNPQAVAQKQQQFFAKLGAYIAQRQMSNFRLVVLKDEQTFNDLKTNMSQYMKQTNTLTPDSHQMVSQFGQLDIHNDMSIGLFLPDEDIDTPYSFNRLLEYELAKMEREPHQRVMHQPYSLKGTLRPTRVILVNLQKYTDPASNIHAEWQQITHSFNNMHKIRYIKNKRLQTTNTVAREPKAQNTRQHNSDRSAEVGKTSPLTNLTQKPASPKTILRTLENIIKRQSVNNTSSNVTRTSFETFMRPNRRRPDDINAKGTVSRDTYRPDIHIWLDTSGSISAADYEVQIQLIIAIAKRLNVDIYFNSFSHVLSETVSVPTKNRPPKQIFKLIEQIPKVTGGTIFTQVWTAIDKVEQANRKQQKAKRIHLIISDMAYNIPESYTLNTNHPSFKDTYYIPITAGQRSTRESVKYFAEALDHRGGKGSANKHMIL